MKIKNCIILLFLVFILSTNLVWSQQSGSIWIKTNKPGSAKFDDKSIDKKALAFLDSLMKRDDIVVTFLGAADNLKWKGLGKNPKISNAVDQAKKLERALELRKRYSKGEVGITDKPFRGVKVVWAPKPPDVFKLRKEVDKLQAMNDSLLKIVSNLNKNKQNQLAAARDSINQFFIIKNSSKNNNIEPAYFDWEIKTGFLAWTTGSPYDLLVPCIGISLKRQFWAFDLKGGFTPWSRKDDLGKRGDAMLMGSISLFPRRALEYKAGAFSGWEFLSKTDNWTMKVLGITAGPSLKWKYFETFVGYSFSRLSTLTESDQWVNGILFELNFKFLIN